MVLNWKVGSWQGRMSCGFQRLVTWQLKSAIVLPCCWVQFSHWHTNNERLSFKIKSERCNVHSWEIAHKSIFLHHFTSPPHPPTSGLHSRCWNLFLIRWLKQVQIASNKAFRPSLVSHSCSCLLVAVSFKKQTYTRAPYSRPCSGTA